MIVETCPKCGEPLMDIMLTSFPPIPKKECYKCGWSWTGEPERIEYKPFEIDTYQEEDDDGFIAFLKYFVFLFENGLNAKLTIDILYQESGTEYWLLLLKKLQKNMLMKYFNYGRIFLRGRQIFLMNGLLNV